MIGVLDRFVGTGQKPATINTDSTVLYIVRSEDSVEAAAFAVPTKAANGPTLGGTMGTGGAHLGSIAGAEGTSPNRKSSGREIFALDLTGALI
jgi:hypothetical protein